MYFYDWVIMKYAGRDSMRGDFAYDIARDKKFPMDGTRNDILTHLTGLNVNADERVIALFKRMYRDFQKWVER